MISLIRSAVLGSFYGSDQLIAILLSFIFLVSSRIRRSIFVHSFIVFAFTPKLKTLATNIRYMGIKLPWDNFQNERSKMFLPALQGSHRTFHTFLSA